MWNFNSFLRWFTSGNKKRFKDFTRNLRNVIGWKCSINFPGILILVFDFRFVTDL